MNVLRAAKFFSLMEIVALAIICFVTTRTSAQTYRGETAEWVLQIGGPGNDECSFDATVDHDGNALISGWFSGTLEIGKRVLVASGSDAFIAKVSPKGDVLWVTQIGGPGDELIRPQLKLFAVGKSNELYTCIYSSSATVVINDTVRDIWGGPASDVVPRFLKLGSDGRVSKFLPALMDPADIGWCRIHADQLGNVFYSATSYPLGPGALLKVSPGNERVFSDRYNVRSLSSQSPHCCTPVTQGLCTDNVGNLYSAVNYNGEVAFNESVYSSDGDQRDVMLCKRNSVGEVVWRRFFTGPHNEGVFDASVIDGLLHVWGYYAQPWGGGKADSMYAFFGSQKVNRTELGDVYHAVLDLDGNLMSCTPMPLRLNITRFHDHAPVSCTQENGLTFFAIRGGGLFVIDSTKATQYYAPYSAVQSHGNATYGLQSACGGHYFYGEFNNTLYLPDKRLESRGGKDIFLAMMKPPGKYVPVRPGLRFPVDSAVDLDIPVQVDWWWVGCANGYRLQLSRDSAMTQVVFDTVYALQPPYTLKNLEHLTKYYWRVRANTADTFSVWSDVRSFTTVKAQPADVVLEYPGNGSRGMQRQVTLRWTASKRASSYLVDVASDSAFTNRVINGKLVSTNALDVTLDANRTFYWRVRAGNSAGSSPWSAVWKFDVRPNTPERTILDKPLNGAQQEPINTVFGWLSQGDGLEYRLHAARDSAFGFIDIDKTTSNAYWQGTLEPSTTYYWRVRASNGYDDGAWSPTWSFSTGTTTSVNESESNPNVRASYADGALLIHLSDDLRQQRSLAVSLFDLSGRQFISTIADNTGSPLRIAVPNLAHGTYILRIGERGGEMVSVKVSY